MLPLHYVPCVEEAEVLVANGMRSRATRPQYGVNFKEKWNARSEGFSHHGVMCRPLERIMEGEEHGRGEEGFSLVSVWLYPITTEEEQNKDAKR